MSQSLDPINTRGSSERPGVGAELTPAPARLARQPAESPDGDFADLGLTRDEVAVVREAIRDRVRRSFRGSLSEADVEDATQDAWEALLREHREHPVRDRPAFAAEVGWRAARALVRRPRALPIEPQDSRLLEVEDDGLSLVDRMDARARFARLAEALEQLDDQKRAAFDLRFVRELGHREACEQLGISRSAYFKRIRAAKASVEAAMGLEGHAFERRQRQLLSDYVAGIAVGRARVRAERLIAADPHAAVIARELRQSHDSAAVVLPALGGYALVDGQPGGPIAGLVDALRETVSGWLGRSPQPGDLASSPALASGAARGAGAAGAGLLAKVLGGLSAGNVALACLAGGAVATVACMATGVLPLPGEGGERDVGTSQRVERQISAPEDAARQLRVAELVAPEPAGPAVRAANEDRADRGHAGSSKGSDTAQAASTVDPSTPPVEQEFGVASAATPLSGAPADTNDSNGAAASTVRGEFGP